MTALLSRRVVFLASLAASLSLLLFITTRQVFSQANHIVISEIQVSGGTGATSDEFVELYNPTDMSVDLAGWRVAKKSAAGTETDLVTISTGTIASKGYFLVTSNLYDGSVAPDTSYVATGSAVIASNNTVLLYSGEAAETLVDKVGMGTATDIETTATVVPDSNGSVERKATATSTSETMASGGTEETHGNGEDTDNNTSDFIEREVSDPQNTSSQPEMLPTPTQTPTPTEEPTETPTPTEELTPTSTLTPTLTPTATPSPSPTVTPSLTPSPTENPTPTLSPTPTDQPTPTPTDIPTSTPSTSPSPTDEPTPTVTPTDVPTSTPSPTSEPTATLTPTEAPTPTLTPTPTPSLPAPRILATFSFPGRPTRVCTVSYRLFQRFFIQLLVPSINCTTVNADSSNQF